MPNSISTDQNTEQQLERLAAQRQLYTDAKLIQRWQMILTVPTVLLWSVVVLLFPTWKVYSALWAIAVLLVNILWLTPLQNTLKRKAAKIQEAFDCDVLHLSWHKLKVGRTPDPEMISAAAMRFQRTGGDFDLLKDWYPKEVASLPLEQARIICQRANCWWDAHLRRRYSLLVVIALSLVCGFVIVLSIIGDFTIERFILTGLMPLVPVLTLSLKRFQEHREGADRADRLKEAAEDLWHLTLQANSKAQQVAEKSRQLQDEIYEHRCRSSLIPSWLYSRLRDDQEIQMNKAASVLIAEAMEAKG